MLWFVRSLHVTVQAAPGPLWVLFNFLPLLSSSVVAERLRGSESLEISQTYCVSSRGSAETST